MCISSWRSGSIERPFYDHLVAGLAIDGRGLPDRRDEAAWPVLKDGLAPAFRTTRRDEWAALFAGTDPRVAPALTLTEGPTTFTMERAPSSISTDIVQPAPPHLASAPRRPVSAGRAPTPAPGDHTDETMADHGCYAEDITRLRSGGALN